MQLFGLRIQRLMRRLSGKPPLIDPQSLPELGTMKALMQGVTATRDQELACDEAYELLDEFAEAVVAGCDVAAMMPLVYHHLNMCPDCREEYEALLRIVEAER